MDDVSVIPIDVHANRLLDWLVSRHHCNKDWPEKISIIRQKINSAMQDMPENSTIANVLANASPINYYHCVKIVEVLKETEAETKNIFGSYGSRRMKDWQDILKSYQKDNLYLAETASILARNVVYEIPALKRLITKLEQAEMDSVKRDTNCKKQAQDCRDKFMTSCTQLGLQFEPQTSTSKSPTVGAVGKQLTSQMSQELPIIFNKIAAKAKEIREAVIFYRKFLDNNILLTQQNKNECLALLLFVIDKGNVTTYEWKYNEPPLKIDVPQLDYSFEEEDTEEAVDTTATIDFGDIELGGSGNDNVELTTGEIDWGDLDVVDDYDGQIDFSIDTAGITLDVDGMEGGVAKNEEAFSVLENPETREQFISDILELEGFLSQRIDETKALKPNEIMLTAQDDSLSLKAMVELRTNVNQLYNLFNENKTKQFLLVRESKRYVIRIAESLLQNLKLARKLDYQSEDSKNRGLKYTKEIGEIRPRIQMLTKQCRELQNELTKIISSKYNNRPVYITGGV